MNCPACGYEAKGSEHICPDCGGVLSRAPGLRPGIDDVMPSAGLTNQEEANRGNGRGPAAAAVRKAAEEAEKKKAEAKAASEAAERAVKDAALKEAAAKEAIAKEKAVREEAIKVIKEAALRDAEARKAVEKEKAAAADIQNAVDDFDRMMKEAAQRTASKSAYLEKAEASKALARANTAKEAVEQAAAEVARAAAEAKKAAADVHQKAAEEAAARRAAEQALAQLAAAEASAGKAGADNAAPEQTGAAAARSAAADRSPAQKNAGEACESRAAEAIVKKSAEEAAARRAAERAAEEAAKKQAGLAVAQLTAEEAAIKRETKEDVGRRHADAAGAKPKTARPPFRYKINEGSFPSVSIMLDETQGIFTQADVMVWMSMGMVMKTDEVNGNLPVTTYKSASGWHEICVASRFPGEIWCLDMSAGSVIVQKGAFLAAQDSVHLSQHVAMQMGGEQAKTNFVFQRLSGEGIALIAVGGSMIERTLHPKEVIKAHIANVAALEERVSFQTEIVPDMKKIMAGGEGRLLCTLTGPGRVWLQTMPTYVSS